MLPDLHSVWRWLCLFLLGGALSAPGAGDFPVFWQDKANYVALRDLAALYQAELSAPAVQRFTLQNRWNTLIFKADSRELMVNGTQVWLHEPMVLARGRWAVREVDASRIIDPLVRPERYLGKMGSRVVVLDPGHGGHDSGARGARGVEEKRVVLDIARRLRAHLTAAGVKVYMTRESDRFIELDERARRAGRWGADAFISIHLNSAGNSSASGIETYALAAVGFSSTAGGLSNLTQPGNRFEGANAMLAYQVHKAMVLRTASVDRGVRRSRFLVLKDAPCPAVLVECGFVSNRKEEERLLSEAHRETLALGLARGTLNYLNLVKRAKLVTP